MNVYWLQQRVLDVPQDNLWLTAAEAVRLDSMSFPKRRTDWRLGRWTAKRSLAAYFGMSLEVQSLADIEIRPAPSGAPEVFFADGCRIPATISISHRAALAMCTVAPSGIALGCDLELSETHSSAFVADYFTSREQELIFERARHDQCVVIAAMWSAKESVLKMLRSGLRMDTRSLEVSLSDTGSPMAGAVHEFTGNWQQLCVQHEDGRSFYGWWRHSGGIVYTIASAPSAAMPKAITSACSSPQERAVSACG